MPAACAACMSRSASPTYTHSPGRNAHGLRGVQQRQRMRLALGQRVAADHRARAGVQADFDQQRIGEPARLVGDDAPVQRRGVRGRRAFRRRLRTGRCAWRAACDRCPAAACAWPRVRRAAASPNDSFTSALAPCETWQRTCSYGSGARFSCGAQRIQRVRHVVRGVEQRAVEIEQHAADGAGH